MALGMPFYRVIGVALFLMSKVPLHTLKQVRSFWGRSTWSAEGTIYITALWEVEIESIRKILARTAETGHSNQHNA